MSIYDLIGNILKRADNNEEASRIIGEFLPFINKDEFKNIVNFIENFKGTKNSFEA